MCCAHREHRTGNCHICTPFRDARSIQVVDLSPRPDVEAVPFVPVEADDQ